MTIAMTFPAAARAPETIMAVPNDDFSNALEVTSIPFSHLQNIKTATTAADDPSFPCYSGQRYNTVWYRYSPAVPEALTFSTDGSQYDLVLGIWTGVRGSLVNQACSSSSQLQFTPIAGTTYYIEVARKADYIIPSPSTINMVFSVWPADTQPAAFGKSAPADVASYQATHLGLSWGASQYAAGYAYCYDSTDNDTCDTTWKTTTAMSADLTGLSVGTTNYWQVKATNIAGEIPADGGTWWSFTTASPADLNHWAGTVNGTIRPVAFDVLKDATQWLNFSVSVTYTACQGGTKTASVSAGGPGLITGRNFNYNKGGLQFNGAFNSRTTASGSYYLNNYAICDWITTPGYCCWTTTSGSGTWTAGGPPLPGSQLNLPLVFK